MKADDFKPGWRRQINSESGQKPVTLSRPPWEKEKDSSNDRD
jgi:hypothetical protein